MSLHPTPIDPVPEETARVAHAAFPHGNRYLQLRDVLGVLYEDADFATLFARRGKPAEPPWRLALVTVMQFAEGLSDRQAAEAVRARIDWKYALGLELTDAGFNFSVLSEFRARLVAGHAEQVVLDRLLAACRERGLLATRGRQRTDSTHVLGLLRELNRLERVTETLRTALEALAVAAPAWLQGWVPPAWTTRYGRRIEEYRLPKGKAERQAFGAQVGADGWALLAALTDAAGLSDLAALPAVQLLRQIWHQQFTSPDAAGGVQLKAASALPPATEQIETPYEPEARYAVKRGHGWTGYKVHLTETCDDDRPHLLTQVTTTIAPAADIAQLGSIQAALAGQDLRPAQQLVDAGYVRGQNLVTSRDDYGIDLVGPVTTDHQWQAQTEGGFDLTQFTIDWTAHLVTCPQGQQSVRWCQTTTARERTMIHVDFAAVDCMACPVRARCTRAPTAPRSLTLQPQAEHEAIQAARQRQQTVAFQQEYAHRAGIEGTISQGVRAFGLRRARYRGMRKVQLQHVVTAAAMNIQRVLDWLNDVPPVQTRRSRFAALAAA